MTDGPDTASSALQAQPFADAVDISEFAGLSQQRVHQLIGTQLGSDGPVLHLPAPLETVRHIDATKRYEAAALKLVEAIGCAVALTPRGRVVAASAAARAVLFRSADELRGVDARELGFPKVAIDGDASAQGITCELRRGRWQTQRSIAVRFKRGPDTELARRQRASLGSTRRKLVDDLLTRLSSAEKAPWTSVLRSEQFEDLWDALIAARLWTHDVELTPHSQSTPKLRIVRIATPSLLQMILDTAAAVSVPEPGVIEHHSVHGRFGALAGTYAARLGSQFCAESCSIFLQDRTARDADPEYGTRSSVPGELTLRPTSVSGLPREFLTREEFEISIALPSESGSGSSPPEDSGKPLRETIILSAVSSGESMAFHFADRPARAPNVETFAANSRLDRAAQCALIPIRNARNETPHTVGVVRLLHFVAPPAASPVPTDVEPGSSNPPAANAEWLAELTQIGHALYVLYRRLVASGWRALLRDTISDLALLTDEHRRALSFEQFVRRLFSRIEMHAGLDFQQVLLWQSRDRDVHVFDRARSELVPIGRRELEGNAGATASSDGVAEIEVPLELSSLAFEVAGRPGKSVAVRNGLEVAVPGFGVLGCYNSSVLTRNQDDALRRGLVRNCNTLAQLLSLAARLSRP